MTVRDLIPCGRNSMRSSLQRASGEEAHPFLALHREMNRMFEDMLSRFDSVPEFVRSRMSWPSIEVSDDEKAVTVIAEVPGMNQDEIEVLLDGDTLTLRGERKSETRDSGNRFSERFYGRFERQIELPAEVVEEGVQASFNNGVLTVTLPKSPSAQSRVKRIPVNGPPGTHH